MPSRRRGVVIVIVVVVVVVCECCRGGVVIIEVVVVVVASLGCRQFEFHARPGRGRVVIVVVLGGLYSELVVWVTKAQWDLVKISTSPRIGIHILY